MVSIVGEISRKHNIPEVVITIAYNGLTILKKAMYSKTRYSCLSNHFNIISAIDHKILKSPLTWFYRHIKRHKDDQTGPLKDGPYLTLNTTKQKNENIKKTRYQGSQSSNPTTYRMQIG